MSNEHVELICPACDTTFGCGVADASCWCSELVIDPDTRDDLAGRYSGCLCPSCLQASTEGTGRPR